jgi:hypothetical protein
VTIRRLAALLILLIAGRAPAAELPRLGLVFDDGSAEFIVGNRKTKVERLGRIGEWTLMEVLPDTHPVAILETFGDDGRLLFVGWGGASEFAKTAQPTSASVDSLYLGHSLDEVKSSASDLLGAEVLAQPGDPRYAQIEGIFPPIRRVRANVYSFIGTPLNPDKVYFNYGGRTANFDPAVYQPSVRAVRDAGQVRDGLVGGWLPALRFVYPEGDARTELVAFAPFETMNGNERVQPVWYRVVRIEQGRVKWVRYVDTYLPYPPRNIESAPRFYHALRHLRGEWRQQLLGAMELDLPDVHMANMARFSLVRAMMTRIDGFPKYGVVETNYGGSEHDGFPDTFNVETTAMIEWGLLERAGQYIHNYFGKFVREDGSLVYRGPEVGQFGRMLTVLAQYANAGGDVDFLLMYRPRIDALTQVLLDLRAEAQKRPRDDPAFGLISGWSEADSVLDEDPQRYVQPYFSNSTEAARGFRDLGRVWQRLGREKHNNIMEAWGDRLVAEGAALRADLDVALKRSTLDDVGSPAIPAIAGAREPFHIAVARDRLDPQHRTYRSYMEMLFSGSLTREQARTLIDYRARHHDSYLGIGTAYGLRTGELAGFLTYGTIYGLIQHDYVREALLTTYAHMAHQYTRGQWLAPETRNVLQDIDAAPYCTPAQLVAPLALKWLLVFEDPERDTLWLAKAAPREWFGEGKRFAVRNAPTRFGRVSYEAVSQWEKHRLAVTVELPAEGLRAELRVRLRAPGSRPVRSVTVNNRPWRQFDAAGEYVVLPAGLGGQQRILASY